MPPIWVLNLRGSPEQRERITADLDELGLKYEFIEAVDGRELAPEELAASYDSSAAIDHVGRELCGEKGMADEGRAPPALLAQAQNETCTHLFF